MTKIKTVSKAIKYLESNLDMNIYKRGSIYLVISCDNKMPVFYSGQDLIETANDELGGKII